MSKNYSLVRGFLLPAARNELRIFRLAVSLLYADSG